jgi:hypothetical protein
MKPLLYCRWVRRKAKSILVEITESNEDIFGKQEAEELLKNW